MKWTELAITDKIHRVLGENTIGYSAIGTCVRMSISTGKETETRNLSPQDDDSSLAPRIAHVLWVELFFSIRQIA
jgi:hypothetical protein